MFKYTFFKTLRVVLFVCAIGGLTIGCGDDDGPAAPDVEAPRVNQFIWEGLNSWYFWQADVPNLSNDVRNDVSNYEALLNSTSDSEQLFINLLNNYPFTDRFSFIVDDYVALDNAFQGISTSYGYEFGLRLETQGGTNVFGWVQYVLPGSPADNAGIVRGDLFNQINGQQLTTSNFRDLLFGEAAYNLGFADIVNGEIITNGESVTMSSTLITENPVYLANAIDLPNGDKVGYLMYNAFISTFHSELNAAFAGFIAEGIDELVVDLRYNGGGSVLTSQYMASMIHAADNDKIFGNITYNEKKSQFSSQLTFSDQVELKNGDFQTIGTQPLNTLNFNTVYILVSGETASASELVINALEPFANVVLIGDVTVGKNVGSLTLYDSPSNDYLNKANANPTHLWAMQPTVSQFSNAVNDSDYGNGFTPSILLDEKDFLGDLKPLGDPQELLLNAALNLICGDCLPVPLPSTMEASNQFGEAVTSSKSRNPFYQDMHLNDLIN